MFYDLDANATPEAPRITHRATAKPRREVDLETIASEAKTSRHLRGRSQAVTQEEEQQDKVFQRPQD